MGTIENSDSGRRSLMRLDFNSPVILGMTFISCLLLLINWATAGAVNNLLAIRYTSWTDPMMYVRMLTHVLVHSGLPHYAGNFMLILAVGPLVEEKYGRVRLLIMIAATALITGLINVVFFKHIALIGASGIVFMLILLASFANIRQGKIPITVLLVAVLYIGNEIVQGFSVNDNISQMGHIVGGICGAGFGFSFNRGKLHHM